MFSIHRALGNHIPDKSSCLETKFIKTKQNQLKQQPKKHPYFGCNVIMELYISSAICCTIKILRTGLGIRSYNLQHKPINYTCARRTGTTEDILWQDNDEF